MAWNQPGNNGQDRDPWGSSKPGGNSEGNGNKGGRDQGPPDLDDIFRKLSKKLGGLGGGKGTGSGGGNSSQGPRPQLGGRVVTIAAAAIVIIWAASGFYTIKEAERGVVTRFGKFSHLVEPGLNWKPTFIDEVKPVNVEAVREAVKDEHAEILVVAAATEADIAELETYEERQMFLEEMGLQESGVSRLIKSAYKLLNLETFLTAGPQEVRAWTYGKGWKAPQCAGVIHSDFEKGFIRAEVIKYDDYIALGSEAACKEAGKMSVEGKDYVVQDGDIMHFRFNVYVSSTH